jgi:hypothetical protein
MKLNAVSVFILALLTRRKNAVASSINFTSRRTNTRSILASPAGGNTEKQNGSALVTSVQLVPRGGAIAGLAAKDVAKIFCGLTSLDAISGTFLPSASCELMGVKIPPNSAGRLVMESVGGAAGCLSLTSFLAVTKKVSSAEKAIAYGLISQLFFLVRGSITNSTKMAEIMPKFKIDIFLYLILISVFLSSLIQEPPVWLMKLMVGYKLLDSLTSYFIVPEKAPVSEGASYTSHSCFLRLHLFL